MADKRDANDTHREDGPAAVDARRAGAQRFVNGHPIPTLGSITRNAADLQSKRFADLRWVVPKYVVEGVAILAGRPKIGKSWLALGVAAAVADGGDYFNETCEQGDVLGLFLEDNDRRLQRRLTAMLGANKGAWPKRLTYATEWPRLNEGGMNLIAEWVKSAEKPRLIIVDVLQRVRALPDRNTPEYARDYAALTQLQRLAGEEQLSIIVLHHQRKAAADDPLDTVSGTLGLTGAADTTMILEGGRSGRVLRSRGRDAPDYDYSVQMDASCRWQILGPEGVAVSSERGAVIAAMKAKGGSITLDEVEAVLKTSRTAVRKLMSTMASSGIIVREKQGIYRLPEGGEVQGDELPF